MNSLRCILMLLLATSCFARHHRPRPTGVEQRAQNQLIDQLSLTRIKNEKELSVLVRRGRLVPLRSTAVLFVRLPVERSYCLPSTLVFLSEIGARYYERFGVPLVVTSAIRTLQVQRKLLRWNRNAAPLHGETASSHPTGATVDISWRRMTREQREFIERMLGVYAMYNQVIYLKEWAQPCYHVMVIPY